MRTEPIRSLRRRVALGAAAAATTVMLLAGCAAGGDGADAPDHHGAGTGASEGGPNAEREGATGSSSPSAAPATTPAESCGARPDDPRIAAAISRVPSAFTTPPMSDRAWSSTILDTSFDPCLDLSYATITVEGATGSSPMQVMLFHRGEYLGTTSDCAPGFQLVRQDGDASITVTYQWPKPGEPNAGAKDSADVGYTWTNGTVAMSGRIPDEAIDESICHTWPPAQ